MAPSPHMLQLLHSASPLTTHGAAAAAGMLRRLAPTDLTVLLGSQIRGFAADSVSVSDVQGDATRRSDVAAAAAGSAAAAADNASLEPAAGAAAAADAAAAPVRPRQDNFNRRGLAKEESLKQAGLWVPPQVFRSLPASERQEIAERQQQYRRQLSLHKPLRSLQMSAVVVNPHQLQVVVALATDAAAGDDNSSSSSSRRNQQEAREQGAAAVDSSAGSSSTPQQQKKQRQQKKQLQQQQQQQHVSDAANAVNPLGYQFITQPQLDKRSCLKDPSEQPLVINLNTQMRIAHDREDFGHAVSLFNQFLAKGIAAAEAAASPADAAADKQQQEDGEQQQQQQQQQLVLPLQYRPDHSTLTLYCRSLVGLADLEERQARLARGADRYQPEQPQQCTVARAEQAVALWGRGSVSNIGFPAYYALIAAYRLAGRHDKAVEAFQALRAANSADALNKHYRLWVAACSAAVRSQNYEAANELARMFSTRQVPFRDIDYRARVANIYRALVRGAAACGKWEDAIYWLQELINNQSLVPVPPEGFMTVMLPAAAAGRMDVVRVMMGAVDQQLALQGAKPLVYHAEELTFVIKAAGAAGDADLVADAWTRLKHDVKQKPTTGSPSGLLGPLDRLNSGGVQVARKPQQPSVAAFKAVVKAYVDCKDFGRALQLVAELEEVYGGTRATSVYGGLSFLPIDELKSEVDISALFMQLKARKDTGQPVSTPMMNVVVRAVGRLGNTESAGKTFEVFGAWGLQPDADSYNAVMESCEASKKFTAIEGLIAYMSSRGVQPNLHSWNLLLSAAAAAQDVAAVESAVQRMLASGMQLLRNNASKALKLAHEQRSESLLQLLRQANEQQGLGMQPQVFNGYWRRGGSSGSNGGSSAGGRAEVWKPGMPPQQKQQQQQQQRVQESRGQGREQGGGRQLQQMLEQQGGGETEERKSLRAGLAAALGAAMNQ